MKSKKKTEKNDMEEEEISNRERRGFFQK